MRKENKDDSSLKIKTRFPPSPTGDLHLGGGRTAIFNWLFARHHKGRFVLRLEDTDKKRSRSEYTKSIIDAMEWLGLDYDEGPFYQSHRFERYREVVEDLLKKEKAYWCYCSLSTLEEKRKQAMLLGKKPIYDLSCRDKGLKYKPGAVVRLKKPREGVVSWTDLVKGSVSWVNDELDDLILLRGDGSPTYHLAVVVDDIDMKISHVIRGDDHLSNTPRQILIYRSIGSHIPNFAHIPMILGSNKVKLSKRHGSLSILEYKDKGYLPEAVLNNLVRLGWSRGDQEFFTREEMVQYFSLKNVGKSPSIFDKDKLSKMNMRYMQSTDVRRLLKLIRPYLFGLGLSLNLEIERKLLKVIPLFVSRSSTLQILAEKIKPYLVNIPDMNNKAVKKFLIEENLLYLSKIEDILKVNTMEDLGLLENKFREVADLYNVKFGTIIQPLRVALVGDVVSPGIFDVIDILGKAQVLKRLGIAINMIKNSG